VQRARGILDRRAAASDPIGGAYAGNSSKGKGKRSRAAGFFRRAAIQGARGNRFPKIATGQGGFK